MKEITIDLGNGVIMEFVLIPAGTFQMGSMTGYTKDDQPVHTVNITKPFYMAKYPCTQAQWEQLMGSNPSCFKGNPSRPVDSVSYDMITEPDGFIDRMNELGQGTFRLPTEAEWEYACRAGRTTEYYWGNTMNDDYCWYRSNANSRTHPVGQKLPNSFGLYDMSGNVWEWCRDWYGSTYYSVSSSDDPKGPGLGSSRVIRGGGWYHYAHLCRSAVRNDYTPSSADDGGGFRLVMDVPEDEETKKEEEHMNNIDITVTRYRLIKNEGKFELHKSTGEPAQWRAVICGMDRERLCDSTCAWFSISDKRVFCRDSVIADLSVCEACGGTGYIRIRCACTEQPVRPSEEGIQDEHR